MIEVKAKEHYPAEYVEGLEEAADQADHVMEMHLEQVQRIIESVAELSGGPGGWPDFEKELEDIRQHWYEAKAAKQLAESIRGLKSEWWVGIDFEESK